ncbi:MAG: NUDIX domain-containing protein [Pseudomonas profundi]|uniref:NUDIX domain-containing protein n=1 Tax=Pseudomonas profundi TaxID=1981513 RepID=UPI003002F46B
MDRQAIKAYLAASEAEQVYSVDSDDRLLGVVPRHQVQRERLIIRCTYVFVFNTRGELCMHRRTLHKRLYPGYWDVAAGGVVGAGESYRDGAVRELEEELGVSGIPLREHFRFHYNARESRLWGGVFSCVWDGPVHMQPEEVMAFRWVDPRTPWRQPAEWYSPDSLLALELLLSRYIRNNLHEQ